MRSSCYGWAPTLRILQKRGTPLYFTDYSEYSTVKGATAAQTEGMKLTRPVGLNPFRAPLRQVSRVAFEDGSTCDCSPTCADSGTCCDDWPELCAQGIYKEQPLPPCPEPSNPPLISAAQSAATAAADVWHSPSV